MRACGLELGLQLEPNNMLVFSLALPLLFRVGSKKHANTLLYKQRRWNQKHTHKSDFICVLLRDKLERKMPDAKKKKFKRGSDIEKLYPGDLRIKHMNDVYKKLSR